MTRVMKGGAALVGLAWCLAGAAGCATAQARTSAGGPALVVPEPPARVVEAVPEPEPEEPGPTPVIVSPKPPGARPPRPPARPERPAAEPQATAPPAEASGRPAVEPAGPPRTLQATDRPAEAEAHIRGLLTAASRDLAAIDSRGLSAGARSQYDSARRFIEQAEDALKQQNLVFAGQLADKAASLAAALRAR
jgi:hypothetical protein